MRRSTNPALEPGVYRIDVPCERAHVFGKWRRAQQGKVHLLELENGPHGTARINFVVFKKPGMFPRGKLGQPVKGEVGALPDWSDVIAFTLPPLAIAETSVSVKLGEALAGLAGPELAAMKDAVQVASANLAVIRAQFEAVKAGKVMNPSAVLHNAAAMTAQTIDLLVTRAAAVPGKLPAHLVDAAVASLRDLQAAIQAAPGKALHALTDFGGSVADNWLKPFVLPAELGLLGVGLVVLGGFMAWEQKRTTPTTQNLMLAGGALALLGGTTLSTNISDLLERATK